MRDREHDFCCEGCRRVWTSAEDAGISELLAPAETRSRRARAGADAGARKAAAAAASGARRETLRIEGMWCASCGLVLEDALMALPGVLDAEASYAASLLRVTWDPEQTALEDMLARVTLLGYRAAPARDVATGHGDTEELFLRWFVSAAIGMWVMWPTYFVLWPAFARGEYASVAAYDAFTGALSLLVLVYGGWPFLTGAWRAARVRRATMDTLVVLGTWTAWVYSAWAAATASGSTYFESAAMIVTIVLIGRWLESFGRRDTASALARLAESAEESAWVVRQGSQASDGADDAERVPVAELAEGATVLVRAGERVPADGVVLQRLARASELVQGGQPVLVMGDTDEGWIVRAALADRDAVRVNVGDTAKVAFDAFPERRFDGRVTRVGSSADPYTGTV
ncbi:MAG: HlyD family efflux transporter periplasmic adaptor subunit, partial [Coriobacteriia bacterium]|nr:HlyD family efflux transporter periplasmic adaptor subunit [Coriobacteriia bacterium]